MMSVNECFGYVEKRNRIEIVDRTPITLEQCEVASGSSKPGQAITSVFAMLSNVDCN